MSMKRVLTVEELYWDRVNEICTINGVVLLGFMPRAKDARKTKCKLFCKDHRVYWETTNVSNILSRKRVNCPECSKASRKIKFTKEEPIFKQETLEACTKYNTEFMHWTNGYDGAETQLTHRCKLHNIITTNTHARSLIRGLNQTSGCISCQKELFKSISENRTDRHIAQFYATGSFPKGTVFTRSDRETKTGVCNYWDVYCPRCGETNSSFIGSLKNGSLPCSCSDHYYGYFPARCNDPDELYLLFFNPTNGEPSYYKIGRSFKTLRRVSNMRNPSGCDITIISRWYDIHDNVYDREQELHSLCDNYHYIPVTQFKGCLTECFTEGCLTNTEVIKTFNL